LSSKDDHFEHLIRYFTISNLATLSTLPLPLVALFTTAHDIVMWERGQNSVAGEGAGSSVCYTLPRPSPRRSVLFFTNSNMVTLRSWSTPFLQEKHAYRSLTDTIQLLSLLSPSLITRSLILSLSQIGSAH